MPTYDYVCESCGARLEFFQSMTEASKRKCPKCKRSTLKRQIGAGAGILFRGQGFYQTDYRSESYKKSAEAEKPAGASATPGPSGPSGDGAAKPESKPAAAKPEKQDAPRRPTPKSGPKLGPRPSSDD
jgi:putative FmdB family regulatory protein